MTICFHKMAELLKCDGKDVIIDASRKIGLVMDSLQGLWFACSTQLISKAMNLSCVSLLGAILSYSLVPRLHPTFHV